MSEHKLAEVIWNLATMAARQTWRTEVEVLGKRVSAIEEDVAAIREHLVVRTPPEGAVPEPQSLRA